MGSAFSAWVASPYLAREIGVSLGERGCSVCMVEVSLTYVSNVNKNLLTRVSFF